jgi:RNA polymerase sigma-70 factor (ECF subfamily)
MIQHIDAAKLGNQKAFSSLYDFYWKSVYGFMLNRTKNETVSHDITHETLVKAFIKINSYKSEYEFNTWLCTIAKNMHCSLYRKKQPMFIDIYDSNIHFADTAPSPEDELIITENNQRFSNSINQLKPIYREVFLLQDEGLTYQEIVNRTGNSLGNVKAKLSRAKAQLSQLVQ